MLSDIKGLCEGLVAQKSLFGWVISGVLPEISRDTVQVVHHSHTLFCLSEFSESAARNFWELEGIGISEESVSSKDEVLEDFERSIKYGDGHYEVKLPWKPESCLPELMNNQRLAEVRLKHLNRKLSTDSSLESKYNSVFRGYLDEGFIEEVPDH